MTSKILHGRWVLLMDSRGTHDLTWVKEHIYEGFMKKEEYAGLYVCARVEGYGICEYGYWYVLESLKDAEEYKKYLDEGYPDDSKDGMGNSSS